MKTKWTLAFIPALFLVLVLAGCYYTPSAANGSARASLMLAKQLPANVASIVLVVSGPGLKTVAKEVAVGTDSVTLEVPAGVARTFTLLANTPSVTLKGEATVDLLPGQTKEIVLFPLAFDSQIIVPDPANNQRLVQIADMQGTGWIEKYASDLGISYFYPWDVDFDGEGRIYIANNANWSWDDGGVFRLDDISDTTPDWLVGPGLAGVNPIYAIAVDRENGYLYYITGQTQLYRKSLSTPPGDDVEIAIGGLVEIVYVKGIAVDSEGYVYLVSDSSGSPANTVLKINPDPPTGPTILASYSTNLLDPWDVVVKSPYVYISNRNGESGYKVMQFDQNLQFIRGFGPQDDLSPPAQAGYFYVPERFVAILSKRLILVDENNSGYNRLVSFNNLEGAGWVTYGTTGAGVGQFNFYDGE